MEQFQTEFFKEDVPRPPQSFFFFFFDNAEKVSTEICTPMKVEVLLSFKHWWLLYPYKKSSFCLF